MLDQKSNETFMGAEWRAMNTDWNLIDVIAVFVTKVKTARLREIDLIGGDGKLTPDNAPRLHVNLRSVKRSFVRYFDKINSRILQNIARHLLGLFPKIRFIHKFLAKLCGIVSREAHQISIDPEQLEIVQIHLVYSVELRLELLRRHIEMSIVHLQRAHSHKPEQFAALFVSVVSPILREPQWQIAIAARQRCKQFVVMRTVHRLEIVVVADCSNHRINAGELRAVFILHRIQQSNLFTDILALSFADVRRSKFCLDVSPSSLARCIETR